MDYRAQNLQNFLQPKEDLAEQAVDELMEIEGMDEKRASELIMTARAPWFAEAEAKVEAE